MIDSDQVFHYSYNIQMQEYQLMSVYKLLNETEHHIQIRRHLRKRWYPKNACWKIERGSLKEQN